MKISITVIKLQSIIRLIILLYFTSLFERALYLIYIGTSTALDVIRSWPTSSADWLLIRRTGGAEPPIVVSWWCSFVFTQRALWIVTGAKMADNKEEISELVEKRGIYYSCSIYFLWSPFRIKARYTANVSVISDRRYDP